MNDLSFIKKKKKRGRISFRKNNISKTERKINRKQSWKVRTDIYFAVNVKHNGK